MALLTIVAFGLLLADDTRLRRRVHAALVSVRLDRRGSLAPTVDLADALRRLAAELAAGRTLETALTRVGRGMSGSTGLAFDEAGKRVARGEPIGSAFRAVLPAQATSRLVASSLALYARTGGDLPKLLRGIAGTVDERQRVDADVRAMTAQARFSAIVVPCLPPAGIALIALFDPAGVSRLLTTAPGLLIVGVAVTLDLMGALLIRRIARGIA